MKPINAHEADYESFEIFGKDALFTSLRIDRKTLPEGLYAYDLRDCDDCTGDPSELKNYVMVNHWGTVVVREPIDGAENGVLMDRNDYNYLGDRMTLEEFANSVSPAPAMEQTM